MGDSGIPYLPFDADIEFPDPRNIDGDVVAIGGNLSPGMLLSAYRRGIFPWFSDEDPILWWSLNPRFVVFPPRLHVSRSLRKAIRKSPFALTLDQAFEEVMTGCRDSERPDQDGTWITDGMLDAYTELHRLGFAHSVEAWKDGRLAGGLYGVSLGGCYYGESMFTRESDASKIAFVALVGALTDIGFGLIDCQQHTRHLAGFGAIDMPRENFLDALGRELGKKTLRGSWADRIPAFPSSNLWRSLMGSANRPPEESAARAFAPTGSSE